MVMNSTGQVNRLAAAATLLSLAIGARPAAAATDAAASARFLAPFLDAQTIAVAQIDLTRATPKAVFDRWIEVLPEAERTIANRREYWTQLHDALTKAGISEAYAVISLADVPVRPPLFVAPKGAGGGGSLVGELTALLKEYPALQVAANGDAVIVASREALARFSEHHPAARPELEAALAAAGDHALRLVVLPTDDDRRVVEELMPTLPPSMGSVPSTVLTHGGRWLAVGMDVDMPTLSVVAQSADDAAAQGFAAGWTRAMDALGGSESPSVVALATALKVIQPTARGDQLVVELNAAQTRGALRAAQAPLREAQLIYWRDENSNRLKQLALGVLNFESAKGMFPPAFSTDPDGKPLLSWRVYILPFIEEADLWRQFHLDEPWDSPHNRALIPKMPEMFRSPASRHIASEGLATYREVVGPHTAFPGDKGITWKQLVDGSSNTILFVDVDDDHAQTWTKPGGLPFDAEKLSEGMGGQFPKGIQANFCDGHFQVLTNPPVDEKMLRALLTIDGAEPLNW